MAVLLYSSRTRGALAHALPTSIIGDFVLYLG